MSLFENTRFTLAPAVLLALSMYTGSTCADDHGTSMFSFNGFGTLGVAHSSEDQADFTSGVFKPDGAGHSHDWSFDVDSLIAAQVTADFTPKLSAVVQVIAEQNYDDTYRPHVEWANIKYQFTPDFSVRIGRTVMPVFLLSDTRKVGYTYPWVRPPIEIYRMIPITTNDGVDVSYRLRLGEVTNTLQAYYGNNKVDLPNNNGTGKGSDVLGITYTAEYGPLTTHIAYQTNSITTAAVNSLFDSFRKFGSQGIRIADKYDSDDKPLDFIGFGAHYDPGRWFVTGEWSHSNFHSYVGKQTAWYVSGGYRIGKFTPFVTYTQATADNLSDPGLTLSALPAFLVGPATSLNAALNAILSTKPVQDTISVGARWDFMKNTALKVQFDHTDIGTGSAGTLINTQPGFEPGGTFNVFSATIDFVF